MSLSDLIINYAKKHPYVHIKDYMERFWILPYSKLGVAARVHHILRSDDDRAFHDHPWPYVTIILKGGYTEVTPCFHNGFYQGEVRRWIKPGSVLFRKANSWHRLEIAEGVDTWTLFITGPKQQSWGFMSNPKNKVYWREYLNDYSTQGTPGEGDTA